MDKGNEIEDLNSATSVNNDRIEGCDKAVNETDEQDLKSLFFQFKATSQKLKQEQVTEVNNLMGNPAEGIEASGKIYRLWMDLKTQLTGKVFKAIFSSCEFREGAVIDIYDGALKMNGSDISVKQHSILIAQRALI